jgi:predicted dehydrogenase
MTPAPDRRSFLKHSAAGLTALGATPLLAATPRGRADTIGIGLIGVGGRGSDHLADLLKIGPGHNAEIVAICDVWKKASARAAEKVASAQGRAPKTFTRYADLLQMPGVDAVVIATPDFSHGTLLNAALAADKDVYVEKPMTIDLATANAALDLARSRNRVVQAGTQRRSDGHFLAARREIASGVLGKVNRVTAAVNFNHARWKRASVADCVAADVDWEAFLIDGAKRPFNPHLLREWQLFRYTSNGLPGLWMTHYADALHMLTGASYPARAVASGGIFVWKDGREHTDTFHAIAEYPDGFLFDWGMSLGNASNNFFTVHGTKGTLDVEKGTVTLEASGATAQKYADEPSTSHMADWLDCIRTRKRPRADIEFGHQHVVATVMAALALETGRRQSYDPKTRAIVAT